MSGNVLKTPVAQLAGGFNESLFIDEVDHEFCYRLRQRGYKILIFYDVKMEHHLGNITRHNIWTGHFNTTNHCGIRRYYMARNMLYIMNEYPEVKMQYFKDFIKMVIKIILAENHKLEKIKYIIKGIQDYRHGKFGKCQ
jgi:rhamnosyltransferase